MGTELENELNTVHEMQNHYKNDIHKMEDRKMNEWSNVHCNDYASKGLAGTALGLGIGALSGLLVNNGNGLGGLFGGGGRDAVTQHDLDSLRELAAKDQRIAILESEKNTNQKVIDTLAYIDRKQERTDDQITKLRDRVIENEKTQLVFNGTVNTAIAQINGTNNCQQSQINELLALTKRLIPNGAICPGWGDVCVQTVPCPSAAGTALAGTDCRK